jgi:hypothetical protein
MGGLGVTKAASDLAPPETQKLCERRIRECGFEGLSKANSQSKDRFRCNGFVRILMNC